MPYIPAGATPAQLNHFATRLARELNEPQARSGLMSVQNAFAKAGGYPDHHAAQASFKASWNPLSPFGSSGKTTQSMYMPTLMGIKAHKLLEWGKYTWKKHRDILSQENITVEDVHWILAKAWSHASWENAIEHSVRVGAGPTERQRGLLRASNLEKLAGMCQRKNSGSLQNFFGLHTVFGQNAEGHFLGVDTGQAMTHILAVDNDTQRRHATAKRWLEYRCGAGDGIILIDGSDEQVGERTLQEQTRQKYRERPFVVDWRGEKIFLPGLENMSVATLTELLIVAINDEKQPFSDEDQKELTSWILRGAKKAVQRRETGSGFDLSEMIQALWRPEKHLSWWGSEMGNIDFPEPLLEQHSCLPDSWDEAYMRLFDQVGGIEQSGPLEQVYNRAIEEQKTIVFQLPKTKSTLRASRERLVISTLKAWMARELGATQSSSYEDIVEQANTNTRVPTLLMFIDTALNGGGRGGAVIPAQARALGCAVVHIGSQDTLGLGVNDESNAWMKNMGTKVLYGLGQKLDRKSRGCEMIFAASDYSSFKSKNKQEALATASNANIKIEVGTEYENRPPGDQKRTNPEDLAMVLCGHDVEVFYPIGF